MENNNNLFTKKLDPSKLLLALIVASVFGVGIVIGIFLTLGRGNETIDPLTRIEINRSTADSSVAIKNNASSDRVLNAKIKTWHYDAGRIIGPTVNLLATRPAAPELYPTYCKDIQDRTVSLFALNAPPANDVAGAWSTWLKSLKDVEPLCKNKDWNGVSLKVTTSGSYFDIFYKTVARYDSTLLISQGNAQPAPIPSSK